MGGNVTCKAVMVDGSFMEKQWENEDCIDNIDDLGIGSIIAIVIALLAIIALIIALFCWCCSRSTAQAYEVTKTDPETVEIRQNRSIYESQAKTDDEKVVLTVGEENQNNEDGNSNEEQV